MTLRPQEIFQSLAAKARAHIEAQPEKERARQQKTADELARALEKAQPVLEFIALFEGRKPFKPGEVHTDGPFVFQRLACGKDEISLCVGEQAFVFSHHGDFACRDAKPVRVENPEEAIKAIADWAVSKSPQTCATFDQPAKPAGRKWFAPSNG